MMGTAINRYRNTGNQRYECLLLNNTDEKIEQDCIRCGRCIDACSMRLTRLYWRNTPEQKDMKNCGEAYIDDCIECGICTYVCSG
jgi:electron transport complex protein RnfC